MFNGIEPAVILVVSERLGGAVSIAIATAIDVGTGWLRAHGLGHDLGPGKASAARAMCFGLGLLVDAIGHGLSSLRWASACGHGLWRWPWATGRGHSQWPWRQTTVFDNDLRPWLLLLALGHGFGHAPSPWPLGLAHGFWAWLFAAPGGRGCRLLTFDQWPWVKQVFGLGPRHPPKGFASEFLIVF